MLPQRKNHGAKATSPASPVAEPPPDRNGQLPAARAWDPGSLLDSAVLLALVPGIPYLVGYFQSLAYFRRLSLQPEYLDFPHSYYVFVATPALVVTSFTVIPLLLVRGLTPTNFKERLIGNSPLIVFALLLIYFFVFRSGELVRYTLLVAGIAILSLSILISKKRSYTISQEFFRGNILSRLLIALSVIIICVVGASTIGENNARRLIEGDRGSFVVVRTRDRLLPDVDGQEFMLIMLRNNSYYLVKPQKPALRDPLIYVVPVQNVLSVEQSRSLRTLRSREATPVAASDSSSITRKDGWGR